jgi:molecular chaperone DnaJ
MCGGSGEKENTSRVRCADCNGHGKVQYSQGFFTIAKACPSCHGEGVVIENPCADCDGMGLVQKKKKLSVTIPKGVYSGARLRLEEEGNAGPRGADPGDLHIVIRVREHELFKRNNDDILYELPVTFSQASLGAKVKVPTVYGEEEIDLKAGVQSGDRIQLRGKGVENIRGAGRGDQIILIHVETPVNLTTRQEELLREFAEIAGDQVQPMRASFFRKVKDFISGS